MAIVSEEISSNGTSTRTGDDEYHRFRRNFRNGYSEVTNNSRIDLN